MRPEFGRVAGAAGSRKGRRWTCPVAAWTRDEAVVSCRRRTSCTRAGTPAARPAGRRRPRPGDGRRPARRFSRLRQGRPTSRHRGRPRRRSGPGGEDRVAFDQAHQRASADASAAARESALELDEQGRAARRREIAAAAGEQGARPATEPPVARFAGRRQQTGTGGPREVGLRRTSATPAAAGQRFGPQRHLGERGRESLQSPRAAG